METVPILTYIEARFKHVEDIMDLDREAQGQKNLAANEWRGALNDSKLNQASRTELTALSADLAAHKLEVARSLAAITAEKSANRDTKTDSRWIVTTLVSVAIAMLSVLVLLIKGNI